jgi:hypothetical protein
VPLACDHQEFGEAEEVVQRQELRALGVGISSDDHDDEEDDDLSAGG